MKAIVLESQSYGLVAHFYPLSPLYCSFCIVKVASRLHTAIPITSFIADYKQLIYCTWKTRIFVNKKLFAQKTRFSAMFHALLLTIQAVYLVFFKKLRLSSLWDRKTANNVSNLWYNIVNFAWLPLRFKEKEIKKKSFDSWGKLPLCVCRFADALKQAAIRQAKKCVKYF